MDLISRAAAIDALKSQLSDWNDDYNIPVRKSIENIERLPSAQPEERTETHACDLISRQAAIDLIKNDAFWVQYAWGGRGHKSEMEMVDDLVESIIKQMKESVMSRLKQMPSAQPETCEGCKHLGKWENEVEYGYPSPCTRCKRRVEDHYER